MVMWLGVGRGQIRENTLEVIMLQSWCEATSTEVDKWEWKLKHRDEILKIWLLKSKLLTVAGNVMWSDLCLPLQPLLSLCSCHTGCFLSLNGLFVFNAFVLTFFLSGMFFTSGSFLSFSSQFKLPLGSFLITRAKQPPLLLHSFSLSS